MSIAEKLTAIAENEQKVYDAGKQAERAITWGILQNYGEELDYGYAFSNGRFTDENYNPLYPILCKANSNSSGQYMFYNAKDITSTKVPIIANCNVAARMFYGCTKLVEIVELGVHEALTYTQTLDRCSSLERIKITGVIGQSISFADCKKLNKASIRSVMEHLSTAGGYTVTLSEEAVRNAFSEVILSNRTAGTETINGLTIVTAEDGSVTLNGTATEDVRIGFDFSAVAGQDEIWNIKLHDNLSGLADQCGIIISDKSGSATPYLDGYNVICRMADGETAYGFIDIYAGRNIDNLILTPQIIAFNPNSTTSEWGVLVNRLNCTVSLV